MYRNHKEMDYQILFVTQKLEKISGFSKQHRNLHYFGGCLLLVGEAIGEL